MASDRRQDLLVPSPPPAAGESDLSLDVSAQATADAAVICVPTGSSRHRPKLPPPPHPPPSSTGTSSGAAQVLGMEVEEEATQRSQLLVKQKKPPAKKFMSPVVTMAIKSPGIRLMLSPRLRSSSTATTRTFPAPTPLPSSPNNKRPSSTRTYHKNKRRKLNFEIWTEFEPIYDGQILVQARCIHCNMIFKVTQAVGTSACLRHLTSCDGKTRLNQMIDQLNTTSSSDASFKDWKFDPEVARNELVKLIVLHRLPFSLVEYPKFRTFVASLNPWFKPVSRITIGSDCITSFEVAKTALREKLSRYKYRVSLTADLWTSNQTLGYLCVILHYIDQEWKLFKRIVKFSLVEAPHDGKAMFYAMLSTLHDWGTEDKIFSITLDNATVNDSFMKILREKSNLKAFVISKRKAFSL